MSISTWRFVVLIFANLFFAAIFLIFAKMIPYFKKDADRVALSYMIAIAITSLTSIRMLVQGRGIIFGVGPTVVAAAILIWQMFRAKKMFVKNQNKLK